MEALGHLKSLLDKPLRRRLLRHLLRLILLLRVRLRPLPLLPRAAAAAGPLLTGANVEAWAGQDPLLASLLTLARLETVRLVLHSF